MPATSKDNGKPLVGFAEAEIMQAKCQPRVPLLYSLQGFQ